MVSSRVKIQTRFCMSSKSKVLYTVHIGNQVGMVWSTPVISLDPSGVSGKSLCLVASEQRYLKAFSLLVDSK